MTCDNNLMAPEDLEELSQRAQANLSALYLKLCRLYTCGGSASITRLEASDLLDSLRFVLGIQDLSDPATLHRLADNDINDLFNEGIDDLNKRVSSTMELWQQVCATMPPIKNIALRDTLKSIGTLPKIYDVYFAANLIPVSIDYPLHDPVPDNLEGVEYVHEWLVRCLEETRYIAQFDTDECIAVLERYCPDYKGLLINLYEPLKKHFG